MKPANWPLEIIQGATFRTPFVWKTGEPGSEVIVDLTDCTARMQVRKNYKATTTEIELTTGNGRVIIGEDTGTITLHLTATETSALTFTKGVYDLEVVFSNGDVWRLLKGDITVDPEVTR